MKRQGSITFITALALGAAGASASAQGVATARADAQLKQQRYQIGQMERVLEGAVEHGATMMRDRLQAVVPPAQAQLLIQENAHARGFRLEGYGVFFDVIVPSVDGSLTWSLRTLDQNDLGLQSALAMLRTRINPGDIDMQQALKRIELQVNPATLANLNVPALAAPAPGQEGRTVTGAVTGAATTGLADQLAAANAQQAQPVPPPDPILDDPNEAYRVEVIQALTDAMLDHSSPLAIGPNEWITIAARRNEDRPRLAPADSGAQSIVIRASGADLAAFRAGQISREEALKRVDRKVF
jgi:hypothetical protein